MNNLGFSHRMGALCPQSQALAEPDSTKITPGEGPLFPEVFINRETWLHQSQVPASSRRSAPSALLHRPPLSEPCLWELMFSNFHQQHMPPAQQRAGAAPESGYGTLGAHSCGASTGGGNVEAALPALSAAASWGPEAAAARLSRMQTLSSPPFPPPLPKPATSWGMMVRPT